MIGKRGFKFVSPMVITSMAAGLCDSSFAIAKGTNEVINKINKSFCEEFFSKYSDNYKIGIQKGYCEYSLDEKALVLTLKGAFIALTYGYLWNKDFHEFADNFYAKEEESYKIVHCFVLPTLIVLFLFLDLIDLCKETNVGKIIIHLLFSLRNYDEEDLIYNADYIGDDISVSTQGSDTIKENNDFQDLSSDLGDEGEEYIFSRNLEQKQENEYIIFENPDL